ncbi:MAG: CHAP domain-containing protein [Candidatus Saccharimonadales bacterium]
MKQRSATLVTSEFLTKFALVAAAVVMSVATPIAMMSKVSARDYTAEINAVQAQIDQYQAEANRLSGEAQTLANELAKLASEKATIQAQVDLNQAKFEKLTEDIKANEIKIANNKDALGATIADMYVDESISPLEMLASSNNIGDYVDKQSYRSSISDQLQSTIDEIKTLKKQLEQQKIEVEQVLADQKSQREALSAKEAERQKLMNDTKGQEEAYQALSAEGQARKRQLQSEQQAAIRAAYQGSGSNAVAGDPSKGGYPAKWANSDYYNPPVDDWGMYARQCVSYTAWKVFQNTGHMPYWGGRGNANQWPGNAMAAGIPVDRTPRAGSVAVMMTGQYGHVAWVESVNANGTVNVSQYNELTSAGWGQYSERYNVSPGTYDYYIHF